jgi:uncharacterized protein YabE (DUF348 family)
MRILLQKHTFTHVIIAGIFCAIVALAGITLATHADAASNQPVAAGKHLITLHDNGQERGILTSASTLREALKEAKITIDPNDLVEPGLDETLVAGQYEVNIYRARPITVIDGSIRQKVLSPYQTARQVAEHAGIILHDEDTTVLSANSNIVADGAGLQLQVTRATPFTLTLYGKSVQAYTQAKTVGEMMKQKNITLKAADTLSLSANTPITADMKVELWRNGKQVVTEDQAIAFPIDQTKDADQPMGYKKVTTPGVDGKRTVSYEVEMKNGVEISRSEIQSVVTLEPVHQAEVIGTKVELPPGTHQDWMAAAGISASDYGFVEFIVGHEGGWEPCKVQGGTINCAYGGSMGYGVVQATPGSKMASAGDDWRTNPITQLRWATSYAVGRYGSWGAAYNYWVSHHNW